MNINITVTTITTPEGKRLQARLEDTTNGVDGPHFESTIESPPTHHPGHKHSFVDYISVALLDQLERH